MRWAQLTLVEDDPAHFDPAFWLDYFKRTRSDGVCLSGGGCVADYPTEVPFHHRSAWPGRPRCPRRTGHRAAASSAWSVLIPHRSPCHATMTPRPRIRTGSRSRPNGDPRRHWSSPEMWVTCALGPYNFEFMTAVHKEIMARYHPDGIFMNRWDGSGDVLLRALPRELQVGHRLRPAAHARPARSRTPRVSRVAPPTPGGCHPDSGTRRFAPSIPRPASFPTTAAAHPAPLNCRRDQPPRAHAGRRPPGPPRPAGPWLVGKSAKEYRATMGSKPVIGLFGIGLEEQYRWKDSVTRTPRSASGRSTPSPTTCVPGSANSPPPCMTERWLKPSTTSTSGRIRISATSPPVRSPASLSSTRSKRPGTTAASRGLRARLVPGSRRIAHPV